IVVGVMITLSVGDAGRQGRSDTVGTMCLMAAAMVAFMGPTMIRSDLRQDLAHLAVLKTWPVRGAAVVRGEILAPAIVLSLVSSALLAGGAAISGRDLFGATFGSGAGRVSFAVASILAASAIITTHLVVHNAAAVVFPAWVRVGTPAAAGVEMMGQNMLVMMGTLIVLALAIVPAAIAAGVAAL